MSPKKDEHKAESNVNLESVADWMVTPFGPRVTECIFAGVGMAFSTSILASGQMMDALGHKLRKNPTWTNDTPIVLKNRIETNRKIRSLAVRNGLLAGGFVGLSMYLNDKLEENFPDLPTPTRNMCSLAVPSLINGLRAQSTNIVLVTFLSLSGFFFFTDVVYKPTMWVNRIDNEEKKALEEAKAQGRTPGYEMSHTGLWWRKLAGRS
ncbi:hypothetical protein PROFUN_05862 [Planoprotostelium fungivorum]|uniref:Transmembrane protein n=1 Tax=Planoprotostelium fungivorum TaxID=1890364 RepID=A0A2P6NKN9_9EUKA|nr:hypothetical protein PROFUN_05862 [Planoprotostelium fungivorum]